MSEMVDRMAAVIAAEIMGLTADQRATFLFPEHANGDTCDRARHAIRLAIMTLREPTAAMIEAGRSKVDCESNAMAAAWSAMVDAIDQ